MEETEEDVCSQCGREKGAQTLKQESQFAFIETNKSPTVRRGCFL